MHDWAATLRAWLAGHAASHALPARYAERFTQLDDFGYRPKRKGLPLLVQEFGLSHDLEVLLADFSDHFEQARPMPYAHTVLCCLEADGLSRLMDHVVISKAVGLNKPDPAI